MKKRKLKRFVLPTLYFLITLTIFTGVVLLGSDAKLVNKEYNYGINTLDNNIMPVIKTEEEDSEIMSPVEENLAEIGVHYYQNSDVETLQQQSLIFYQNTYMPNTGVLYISDDIFNVMSVSSGVVEDIKEDEFFGSVITIKHNDNLKTVYYGLEDLEVSINDEITARTVLGISKNNEVMNNKKSFLFEVHYNNELINPETFIGTKLSEYK